MNEQPPEGVIVLELEIVWHAPFLPYSHAHREFMEHAHACAVCSPVVHGAVDVPEDEEPPLCPEGSKLSDVVQDAIDRQHSLSMQN